MPTPTEIVQAIAAVKNSIAAVKLINQYAAEIKDTQKRGELMRIIGELNIELANAQIQLAELKIQNYEQTRRIEELEEEIEELKNPAVRIVLIDGLYYKDDNDGPFCTGCYDTKQQLVRLKQLPETYRVLGNYQCPSCETQYR